MADYYRPKYNTQPFTSSFPFRGDYYRPRYSLLRRKDFYRPLYPSRSADMYHFQDRSLQARPESWKHLTCRRWANSLTGCNASPYTCQYSHCYTGQMSPPGPYTCYFWSIGDCKFHKDDCLYAHTYNAMPSEVPRHFGYYRVLSTLLKRSYRQLTPLRTCSYRM